MARDQEAPSAADSNTTRRHAKTPIAPASPCRSLRVRMSWVSTHGPRPCSSTRWRRLSTSLQQHPCAAVPARSPHFCTGVYPHQRLPAPGPHQPSTPAPAVARPTVQPTPAPVTAFAPLPVDCPVVSMRPAFLAPHPLARPPQSSRAYCPPAPHSNPTADLTQFPRKGLWGVGP